LRLIIAPSYGETDNKLVRDVLCPAGRHGYQGKTEAERTTDRTKAGIATYRCKHGGKWGATPLECVDPKLVAKIKALFASGTGIGKTALNVGVGVDAVRRIARDPGPRFFGLTSRANH
jgi:hypothetical protein